jgi:lysophospholipid acyltransferase (LPLAT)-like uncharacterized protein
MTTNAKKENQGRDIHELNVWQRFLLGVLVGLIRLWSKTVRLKVSEEFISGIAQLSKERGLILSWHNRLFMGPELLRRYVPPGEVAALVSASSDGAWLSAILKGFGIKPVRGSRHRRGREALRELIKARQEGCVILITPDGSRGPVYVMKPGAALLARETGSDVFMFSVNYNRAWTLRSWDRFYVPLPFSKATLHGCWVPAETLEASETVEVATEILQSHLDAITKDGDRG